MSRVVRCGLIQASNALSGNHPLPQIKKAMIEKHLKLIEQAAKKKVRVLCLQELFYGPYFCAEQDIRWYELTERVPGGPTTKLMQKIAATHGMCIPDSGKSFTSHRGIVDIPSSTPSSPASACISATTVIFLRAHEC